MKCFAKANAPAVWRQMKRATAAFEGDKVLILRDTPYISTAPQKPSRRAVNKDRVITLSDVVEKRHQEIIWRGHDGYVCFLLKTKAFALERG